MDVENNFNKALMYLDRGKIDIAKNILEEILEISKTNHNPLYCIRANTVLGELYYNENNKVKAKKYLMDAVNTIYIDGDDLVDYEKKVCENLMTKIRDLQ